MVTLDIRSADLESLRSVLGGRIATNVPLARFTSARLGGPADALVSVHSSAELIEVMELVWRHDIKYVILGGGSNILVSDAGVRGLVILNRARQVRFDKSAQPPRVWAESGANFGATARLAALQGLGGLTWATGVPGTIGGAVVGNAGAHGEDMAGNLMLAEILHRTGAGWDVEIAHEEWTVDQMMYEYRSSLLKRNPGSAVVLSATLRLERSSREIEQTKINEQVDFRRRTQPPGASMGSIFKNPPGDYAGRLIEAAGMKGTRIGDAQISPMHANFILNHGNASARDIRVLIEKAHREVIGQFGIDLELEIELVGEWSYDE